MPLPLPRDTALILGKDAVLCDSRSFLSDRQSLVAGSRQESIALFERLAKLAPAPVWGDAWRRFLAMDLNLTAGQVVFGRLKSRMLTNLWALGLEPANPLLGRFSGQPFIPGSAIKGCALQMANELIQNQTDSAPQAELACQVALAFGWSTLQRNLPLPRVKPLLWRHLAVSEDFSESGWQRRFPRYGGKICFLPAHPWFLPHPDLELDVMATNHPQYYAQRAGFESAPDVEPSRVFYHAAVAPGAVFAFAVPGTTALHETARTWLRQGLALIGLGARKSAGYGWFDTSEEVQAEHGSQFEAFQRELRKIAQQQQEQEQRRQEFEASQRSATELSEKLGAMDEEERREFEWLQLKEVQFWGKLQRFRSLSAEDQGAVIRVLQQSRVSVWDELKQRARKGGQWAQLEHAIRSCARDNELGRMP